MDSDTQCAYCKCILIEKRTMPFNTFVCSARCEMALCDDLDGCSWREVFAWWENVPNMSQEVFLQECAKRGVKP